MEKRYWVCATAHLEEGVVVAESLILCPVAPLCNSVPQPP